MIKAHVLHIPTNVSASVEQKEEKWWAIIVRLAFKRLTVILLKEIGGDKDPPFHQDP